MKWTIVVLIALGLISAAAVSLLVSILRYDTRDDSAAIIEVVVAKRAMPAMSVVSGSYIGKDHIKRKALPEGFLTDPSQVVGKVLSVPVVEGQVLTRYCFVTEGTGAQLAAALPYGMRAVSVPVSSHSVMGGLLYPGCVVDVLVTFNLSYADREKGQAISTTLLHKIQVLAVQDTSIVSKPEPDKEGTFDERRARVTSGVLTVTLMVDAKQAEALQLAKDKGQISLAMRNPLDRKVTDLDPTVLSEGRLARLGSALGPSVFATQNENGMLNNPLDPNATAEDENEEDASARLATIFEKARSMAEGRHSPQWEVTVIRGLDVKKEVVETSKTGGAVTEKEEQKR
jgi:pilus assembly protein CpaB